MGQGPVKKLTCMFCRHLDRAETFRLVTQRLVKGQSASSVPRPSFCRCGEVEAPPLLSPEVFFCKAVETKMQSVISVIFPALLLIGCLDGCVGIGCARWTPKGDTDVCCEICEPGNHMARKRCGLNPKDLCVPCEANTYTTDPSQSSCTSCSQCTGVWAVKQDCTSTTDTVCGCATGYRCETAQCTSCVEECREGKEPTENGTCQTCPEGTFNNRIHQKCTPWRTSCPHPGEHKIDQGTAFQDIICRNLPTVIVRETKSSNEPDNWVTPIVCLFVPTIMIVACLVIFKALVKKKTPNKPSVEKPPADGSSQVVQPEDCSLCRPQQEQGGSMDSIGSQGSDSKLLPV
ncbi:hypothetical protein AAFF_G00207250 [Aldrovandia affinis]|uniref:TNFR-Cys domain-containing protein n=1 Tax=Aldrovandia affinis TaxID=143900 RepID=A0AAD7RHG9_9TELE|nr:hypothetical protein AAFF_G00207250 [Aldrovandia affinis]